MNGSWSTKLSVSGFVLLVSCVGLFSTIGCKENTKTDSQTEVLILVNARLFDGSGSDVVEDAVVVIRDGRIEAAGPTLEVAQPSGARIIDLDGRTVLPGLINAHVHDSHVDGNLAAWLEGGVTTVRDTHVNPEDMEALFALRDARQADHARVISSGPLLTTPGGYPLIIWELPAIEVEDEDDAHRWVRFLAESGADFIKIAVESGFIMSGISDVSPPWPTLNDAELEAIVDEADEVNFRVAAHVTTAVDLERVVDAGVDDVVHGVADPVSDELIRRMVNNGIIWNPTLELWSFYYDSGFEQGLPTAQDNLRRFVEMGGTVALGTDYAGGPIPFDLGTPMTELLLMQEAGMRPAQVLVAATSGAAAACGQDDLGRIAPDMIADAIVVDGDPLSDLRDLEHIAMVIHDGSIVRNELD